MAPARGEELASSGCLTSVACEEEPALLWGSPVLPPHFPHLQGSLGLAERLPLPEAG